MKKTMIYLPDDLHRYLSREAREHDTSMAALIREAVTDYRDRRAAHDVGIDALIACLDTQGSETDYAHDVDEGLAEYYAPAGLWDRENAE